MGTAAGLSCRRCQMNAVFNQLASAPGNKRIFADNVVDYFVSFACRVFAQINVISFFPFPLFLLQKAHFSYFNRLELNDGS